MPPVQRPPPPPPPQERRNHSAGLLVGGGGRGGGIERISILAPSRFATRFWYFFYYGGRWHRANTATSRQRLQNKKDRFGHSWHVLNHFYLRSAAAASRNLIARFRRAPSSTRWTGTDSCFAGHGEASFSEGFVFRESFGEGGGEGGGDCQPRAVQLHLHCCCLGKLPSLRYEHFLHLTILSPIVSMGATSRSPAEL